MSKYPILNDEHADYLYESSFQKQLEREYNEQFQRMIENNEKKEYIRIKR